MTPEQMTHFAYLLREMFTESAQTWADVVRTGTSRTRIYRQWASGWYSDVEEDEHGEWDTGWDSDVEEDKPNEPSTWDLGIPLDVDEEW